MFLSELAWLAFEVVQSADQAVYRQEIFGLRMCVNVGYKKIPSFV
jgi:hypothetical protein